MSSERIIESNEPLSPDFVVFKKRLLSIDATNDFDNSICLVRYSRNNPTFLLLNEVIALSGAIYPLFSFDLNIALNSCSCCTTGRPKTTVRDMLIRLKISATVETRKKVINAFQKLSHIVKDRAKHISIITVSATAKLLQNIGIEDATLREIQTLGQIEPDPLNNDKGKISFRGDEGRSLEFRV